MSSFMLILTGNCVAEICNIRNNGSCRVRLLFRKKLFGAANAIIIQNNEKGNNKIIIVLECGILNETSIIISTVDKNIIR